MSETPAFPHDLLLYRRIVEDSPAAVVLLTNEPAARLLYASQRITEISGFSPDELLSEPGLWVARLHPDEAAELGARWTAAVERGERFRAEYRFLHRSGEWRWLRETSSPVRETDGTVRYRQSFTEDITAERFAEQQAERSEARYRSLVERLPVVVYVDSDEPEPRSLYVSPNGAEILGYTEAESIADPELWLTVKHPEDRERTRRAWVEAVQNGTTFLAEYRNIRPDGSIVWIRDQSIVVHDDEGRRLFRQGVLVDITAEREAEVARDRTEARYRALVERLPTVVYIDSDEVEPKSLYVSPNSHEILGYAAAEYIADDDLWFDSIHPDDLQRVRTAWARSVLQRVPFNAEYRNTRPDGSILWVSDSALLVHDEEGRDLFWQGVLLDITAQKEAEIALTDSERRYRALVEQLPSAVYFDEHRGETSTVFVSPQVELMTGIGADRWMEEPGLSERVIHPDDRDRVRRAMAHANETGGKLDLEYRWRHVDGRVVWVHDTAGPVFGDDGRVLYWLGVMTDVTTRKVSELDLARSEARYRALVEQVPAIVYEMGPDDERRTLFVSPHVERILGYSRQEWLDQPDFWIELLHPDDREIELAAHDLHNETGESWHREYRLTASDGRIVWVRDQAELVRGIEDDRSRWLGVMLDITAQKGAEELQRLTAEELELRVLTRTAELEDANEMMALEIGERRRIERQLREAELRYRLLVEDLPAAVYCWETNWGDDPEPADVELYTSPQLETLLGFPRSAWHRPGFWQERLHPHDRDRILPLAERSIATGEPFSAEYRYLGADGRVVWVLDRATLRTRDARGRPRLFQGVMLDITELKNAEAKAREAEERFRRLAEQGPFVVYQFDLEHSEPPVLRMRYLSPSAVDLLGVAPSLWEGGLDAWFEMMHPDDVERMTTLVHRALQTGGPWNYVFRMIASDGRIVWLLDRGQAIERDDQGRPTSFQGVMLDVTEEAEVHAALETSEAAYRSIVETMPAVPWTEVVDPETGRGRYRFIGPQVEEVFGYTPSELLAEQDHFFRLVHPDDRERLIAADERCNRTGEPWDELYRVIHRDGSVRWICSSGDRTFEHGRSVWHGIAIDVTRHVAAGRFPVPVGKATEPGTA